MKIREVKELPKLSQLVRRGTGIWTLNIDSRVLWIPLYNTGFYILESVRLWGTNRRRCDPCTWLARNLFPVETRREGMSIIQESTDVYDFKHSSEMCLIPPWVQSTLVYIGNQYLRYFALHMILYQSYFCKAVSVLCKSFFLFGIFLLVPDFA